MVPAGVEIAAVQLPGREDRFDEPPCVAVEELLPEIVADVRELLDVPYALYGHSMGAVLAFEVARALRHQDVRQPAVIIVSSRVAPHLPTSKRWSCASDAALVSWMEELRGARLEAMHDRSLVNALLPTLRADLTMNESYKATSSEPLPTRIVGVLGLSDSVVSSEMFAPWREHTKAEFRSYLLQCGHFFDRTAEFFDIIRSELSLSFELAI
jgi:medium-chain acyl-[acyl-carrier-protein] hydrolase